MAPALPARPLRRPDTADPMTLAMLRLIHAVDAWQQHRDAATRAAAIDAFAVLARAAGADPRRDAALRTAASMLLDPPDAILDPPPGPLFADDLPTPA